MNLANHIGSQERWKMKNLSFPGFILAINIVTISISFSFGFQAYAKTLKKTELKTTKEVVTKKVVTKKTARKSTRYVTKKKRRAFRKGKKKRSHMAKNARTADTNPKNLGPKNSIKVAAANPMNSLNAAAIQTQADKTPTKKDKKWSISVSTSYGQGLDEFAKGFTYSSASMSYSFGEDDRYVSNIGLSHLYKISKYEDPNKPNSQLEDIELGVTDTKLFELPKQGFKISTSLGATLPTSLTSQKATMRGALDIGVRFSQKFRYGSLSQGNTLILYNHEYKTADEFGSRYNSQYVLVNSLGYNLPFLKKLSWNIGAKLATVRNYNAKVINVQTYSSGFSYNFIDSYVLSVSYRTKDRIITNNSLFDDDNTMYMLGLSATF